MDRQAASSMKKATEQPEPVRYGLQPDGVYLPGPEEILEACLAIQANWSHAERRERGLIPTRNKLEIKHFDHDSREPGIRIVKDPGIR